MAIVKGTNSAENIYWNNGSTDASDTIFGYGGKDIIFGMGGDDVLKGGGGADVLYGNEGNDWADYLDSNKRIEINLTTNENHGGTAEGDQLFSVENVSGSNYDDQIIGDGKINHLVGGGGDDYLSGNGGADTLDGGNGVDTASYFNSPESVTVSLYNGAASGGDAEGDTLIGIENLTGSLWGDDHLSGNDADNVLDGWDGDDVLKGYGGNDTLIGGWDADVMAGGTGNDTYRVQDHGDAVLEGANAGLDDVWSWIDYTLPANVEALHLKGSDPIDGTGNGLDNIVSGNSGANVLIGGGGQDQLFGHGGGDTFLWQSTQETTNKEATADIIYDFNLAEGDHIDLCQIDADVYTSGNQAFTFIGENEFTHNPNNPDEVVAGEVRWYHLDGRTYIALQTGHGGDAEAVIRINGYVEPEASWFYL